MWHIAKRESDSHLPSNMGDYWASRVVCLIRPEGLHSPHSFRSGAFRGGAVTYKRTKIPSVRVGIDRRQRKQATEAEVKRKGGIYR